MIKSLDLLASVCLLLDTNSVNNIGLLSKENSELITQIYSRPGYWKNRVELFVGTELSKFSYNWRKIFSFLVKEKKANHKPYKIGKLSRYNDDEAILLALYLGLKPDMDDISYCCKRDYGILVYLLPLVNFDSNKYLELLTNAIDNKKSITLKILLSDERSNACVSKAMKHVLGHHERNNSTLKVLLEDKRCPVQKYLMHYVKTRQFYNIERVLLYANTESVDYQVIIDKMHMNQDVDIDILTLFCQHGKIKQQQVNNMAMKIAIENNRFKSVKSLYQTKGPYCNEFLSSFFVKLIRLHLFDMVDLLFELGVNYVNNDALVAILDMHFQKDYRKVQMLKKFLPPVRIDDCYSEALYNTISKKDIETVKLLTQYCHDMDILKKCLNMSIESKNMDMMWFFLNKEVIFDDSTVEIAIFNNLPEALIALLTKCPIKTEMLYYFIGYACKMGHAGILKILLDISKAYRYVHCDFYMKDACLNQYTDIVELLMEKGEKPYTDIIYTNETLKITTFLLSKGYNISSSANDCIKHACLNGHIEIVKILIQREFDPCLNDNIYVDRLNSDTLETVIESACINGYTDIVTLLMNSGKIKRISKNTNPNFMLVKACRYGYTKIVELLLENYDVDPSVDNNYCIKQVCLKNYVEILRLLLNDYRADPACDNNYCIINAYKLGHSKIVDELLWDGRTGITKIELAFKYT